jgi:hypothetical protein
LDRIYRIYKGFSQFPDETEKELPNEIAISGGQICLHWSDQWLADIFLSVDNTLLLFIWKSRS